MGTQRDIGIRSCIYHARKMDKLEAFRKYLVQAIQSEVIVNFQRADILIKFEKWMRGEAQVDALTITADCFHVPDLGITIQKGVEIIVNDQRRTMLSFLRAQRLKGDFEIPLRLRPMDSRLMPPILNSFGRTAMRQSVRELANPSDENSKRSAEDIFNGLLLMLWSHLFMEKCRSWRERGVSNLPSERVRHLGTWFLRGQDVGSKPLCDGICARCGALLRGAQNQNSALSNKSTCVPIDINDNNLFDEHGAPQTNAQPPFLLRYSPDFFAKEQPDMFEHDPGTNKLSLRGDIPLPWLAMERGRRKKNDKRTWLCCCDCSRTLDTKAHGTSLPSGKTREHVRDI